MKAAEIEKAVKNLDNIRIVIRVSADTRLGTYSFQNKAAGNATIAEWLSSRILPIVSGHEVVVVNGNGAMPKGNTILATVRASYEH